LKGAQVPLTRFDDLLLDAVAAIQAMVKRGKGWEQALPEHKGRAVELARGLAGERRYAKQAGEVSLLPLLDALQVSAEAQLRMLEGRTTPGDEERAARLTEHANTYAAGVAAPTARVVTTKPAKKTAVPPRKKAKNPVKVAKKPVKLAKKPAKVAKKPARAAKKPAKVAKKPVKVAKKRARVAKTGRRSGK
jgi:hypothetical protein